MQSIKVTLCPDCGHCPSIEIDDKSVRIREDQNAITLTHAAWNDLIARVQRGELKPV